MSRKRKLSKNDQEEGSRKRRAPIPVDIKQPRHRSVIPTARKGAKKNVTTSCYSYYHVNSLSGDLGGSTLLFEAWRCRSPFNILYQAPTFNSTDPVGFADYAEDFKYYTVLGCQVNLLYYPTAYHKSGDTYYKSGGQLMVMNWQRGLMNGTPYPNTHAFHSKPKTHKVINAPMGTTTFYGQADFTDILQDITPVKYKKKFWRKPTMDIGAERMSNLRNDATSGWLRTTGPTSSDPSEPDQWGLRIDVLPQTLAVLDNIFYELHIRVKWYLEFSDGQGDT